MTVEEQVESPVSQGLRQWNDRCRQYGGWRQLQVSSDRSETDLWPNPADVNGIGVELGGGVFDVLSQYARTRTIPEIVPWKYSPDAVMRADICRVSCTTVAGIVVDPIWVPSFESMTAKE